MHTTQETAVTQGLHEYQKRGYLLENFRLFHQRGKGVKVDYHYHTFCKLLLLIAGSGTYVVDGQRYLLQPGDAVLIGDQQVHRPELDSSTIYERIILYISPDFLRSESSSTCELLSCFNGESGHVLRLPEAKWQKLISMAGSLEQELSANEQEREISAKAIVLGLLALLHRFLCQDALLYPEPIQPKNDRILDILRYLDNHLTEDLDIDQLAEAFYISKYHMMRLFRRETDMTIHSYLTQRRLLLAKDLINQGIRATEACYRCGFRSYSSFTRAYGKQFGTTPTGRRDTSIVLSATYE